VLLTLNSESSIARLGFFGPASEYVYGLTHTETMLLWHSHPHVNGADELIGHFPMLRESVAAMGVRVDYFVDCVYHPLSQRLFVLGGTSSGNLEVLHVNKEVVTPALSLHGGHHESIRGLHWDTTGGSIVSGGEDSLLSLWTPAPPALSHGGSGKFLSHAHLGDARQRTAPY